MEINSSEKIRTFLALPVDEKYYNSILNLQSDLIADLEHLPHAVHWTKKHRLHLTLYFLGYQFPHKIENLINEIKKIRTVFSETEICFSSNQIQLFPTAKPTVIALTGNYPQKLKILRQQLMECLKKVQIHPDLSHENGHFLPHITLGKLKEPTDLKPQFLEMNVDFNKIVLYKSEQIEPGYVTHTSLYSWSLY